MPVSTQNNVLQFLGADLRPTQPDAARDPQPLVFDALPVIAVENLAEWFNGNRTNRELALEAAEEFSIARGWR